MQQMYGILARRECRSAKRREERGKRLAKEALVMKIVNIDAPEEIAEVVVYLDIPEFVSEVIRPLEQKLYNSTSTHQMVCGGWDKGTTLPLSPIWQFEEEGYENIAALVHAIPIYLRDQRPIVRGESLIETSDKKRRTAKRSETKGESEIAKALLHLGDEERPRRREVELVEEEVVLEERGESRCVKRTICVIDPLGMYFTSRNGNSPYVELYLTEIAKASRGDDRAFKWLFATVLIHELAHAALDVHNLERSVTEKVLYSTEFGRWREESMANAVTLEIIKDYGRYGRSSGFYKYAKQFMKSQPAEYALGVLMDADDFWQVFDSKHQGVAPELQQAWLDYVKGNPDEEGLKKWNDVLNSSDVYLFEGEYFTDEEELVYAVVKKMLSDYEKKNGSKMPFAEFSSRFPCFEKHGKKKAYAPVSDVEGDDDYKEYQFSLQEGTMLCTVSGTIQRCLR